MCGWHHGIKQITIEECNDIKNKVFKGEGRDSCRSIYKTSMVNDDDDG